MIKVAPEKRSASLRYYHRQAERNCAQGLTVKGKRRERARNARTVQERLLGRRRRGLEAWNRTALKRNLLGLTTRGTPKIIVVRRDEAVVLQKQVEVLAVSLAKCFPHLPASGRRQALKLGKQLAAIKARIV
jgi:hypothetical protein